MIPILMAKNWHSNRQRDDNNNREHLISVLVDSLHCFIVQNLVFVDDVCHRVKELLIGNIVSVGGNSYSKYPSVFLAFTKTVHLAWTSMLLLRSSFMSNIWTMFKAHICERFKYATDLIFRKIPSVSYKNLNNMQLQFFFVKLCRAVNTFQKKINRSCFNQLLVLWKILAKWVKTIFI